VKGIDERKGKESIKMSSGKNSKQVTREKDNTISNSNQSSTLQSLFEQTFPSDTVKLSFIILSALLLRVCVSLNYYSGEDTPPKYGDFECHRVWMQVTYNLDVSQWYSDTIYSNKTYWPMDYPPLCAYTHYLMA
jgi:hypothetical protein